MSDFPNPWLFQGDCIEWLGLLPDASVDAVVSDPPYGLGTPPDPMEVMRAWANGEEFLAPSRGGFMGRVWDAFVPGPELWKEVFRVLKPGGHVVAFAATRTVDWTTLALRIAGLEVRDIIAWGYSTGFPKSHDVSKALDKKLGAEREVVGKGYRVDRKDGAVPYGGATPEGHYDITAPASEQAKQWDGWGTALKPCFEPAVFARKPLEGSVADNVLAHGVGGINIAGCSFAPGAPEWFGPNDEQKPGAASWSAGNPGLRYGRLDYNAGQDWTPSEHGRWPGNIVLVPKPSRGERERGTLGVPPVTGDDAANGAGPGGWSGEGKVIRNNHPTVKPVRLMRWLCRLVTPPGGLVIDPFTGSGATGIAAMLEGFRFGGSEMDERFHLIASYRIRHAKLQPRKWRDTRPGNPKPWE